VTFTELPRAVQVQLAAVGPLLFGLVCGFVLELNAAAYWTASGLSVIGGLMGGTEHAGRRSAAVRGTIAGACFGLGVVIAHAASERPALAPLPSPVIALILITAAAGGGLAAAGAQLASRR
jgi:hypothetical protein